MHERRQDGSVANFLDDQHCQRRFVPRQSLTGRILNRPKHHIKSNPIKLTNQSNQSDRFTFTSFRKNLSVAEPNYLIRNLKMNFFFFFPFFFNSLSGCRTQFPVNKLKIEKKKLKMGSATCYIVWVAEPNNFIRNLKMIFFFPFF